jgi:hypothetical protein
MANVHNDVWGNWNDTSGHIALLLCSLHRASSRSYHYVREKAPDQ